MFVAMLVLAVIYAMLYQGGSGVAEGARFRRSDRSLRGLRFCGAQPCKPEHRAETNTRTIGSLLCRVTVVGTVIGLIYKPALPGA